MGWILAVFWLLVLVALFVAAQTALLDARAREMGDELDKEVGQ
jgi:CBS domain containing-hemolysin-like protein